MSKMTLRKGSLVLYKNRPARIKHAGTKIEIERATFPPFGAKRKGAIVPGAKRKGNETLQVRPKDVTLLHPGPIAFMGELETQAGEVETAWEILTGDTTTLADLAELIYGTYTPATAWAAWELVSDGLYFYGTPKKVLARTPQEVAQEQAARKAKAANKRRWESFLERVRVGQVAPEDAPYLQDVAALALGQRDKSRVLRQLGRSESQENAHALLLKLGHWDHMVNPYPRRLGLVTAPPTAVLPDPGTPADKARTDLTHLPAFAIDDEGNQDPDDALSLEGNRLWVHIADVAALVSPNSPADQEARARGANLYLPEETVPMLPLQATQVLGLGLTEISPALSFGLDLDGRGEIVGIDIMPSWVRVTRLTYAEADARLEQDPLQGLYQLAQRNEARRRENGAVTIEFPEVKIWVDDGQVIIRPLPPLKSRDMVREAMLLAGEAAARFALQHDIPFPFSTQSPPETDERPTDLAGMFTLRRTLKPSQIKTAPGSHAGLGMSLYTRATSPLRRYLDLVAHQQIRAYLRGEDTLDTQAMLERIGAAEAVTGSVRLAERLARRHWTLVYLLQHPDWRGEGVLVTKYGSRGTVLIPELDLEPRLHLRKDLPLNTVVPLALTGVDLPELEAHLRVVVS